MLVLSIDDLDDLLLQAHLLDSFDLIAHDLQVLNSLLYVVLYLLF